MPLYIVRNGFRSGGEFYPGGSLLEDLSDIKLAKIRLNQRDIIPVPEDEKEQQAIFDWVEVRYNVDLAKEIAERVSKGSTPAATEKPEASTPPPGTKPVAKPTTAKATTVKPTTTVKK